MQQAIFKVIYTGKEVAKIYIKWCLKYGNYDNVIKQKVKKGMKHVKHVVQSWYFKLY